MNRIIQTTLSACFIALVAVSCRKEQSNEPDAERIEIFGFEDIDVSRDGDRTHTFTVNANRDWSVSRRESSWVDVIPCSGRAGKPAEVTIIVDPNYNAARETMLTLTCGSVKRSVRVGQEAAAVIPVITVSGVQDGVISFSGSSKDSFSFTVNCTVAWSAVAEGLDWAEVSTLGGSAGETSVSITPTVNKGNAREGTYTISVPGLDDIIVTVIQAKAEFVKPIWIWTLDEEHIYAHLNAFEEDQTLNTFIATDDNYNGTLKFVHTHPAEDYVTSITPEIPDRPYYTDIRPLSAKNEMGYGYLGGMKGDYWEFVCPVLSTVPAGSTVHIRFLVYGSNQSPAFWNGSYAIDGGEEVMLHVEERNYRGGGKASKPTWNLNFTCSYVLGWDLPGSNYIIPHLIEENVVLGKDMESEFRYRLIVADDTFTKAIIEWSAATGRSLPSSSLSFVPAATYYVGREDKIIIEAITTQ